MSTNSLSDLVFLSYHSLHLFVFISLGFSQQYVTVSAMTTANKNSYISECVCDSSLDPRSAEFLAVSNNCQLIPGPPNFLLYLTIANRSGWHTNSTASSSSDVINCCLHIFSLSLDDWFFLLVWWVSRDVNDVITRHACM